MSFSSRRRNYLLTPHRRDGLIEWMKSMLMHSFVLDALETTGADTFTHFEMLIDEHRQSPESTPSRLKQLVPTVGQFHTHLPLRKAFEYYNQKHHLTKRKHITISFNEIRHILNLAQIMALAEMEGGNRNFQGSRAALGQIVEEIIDNSASSEQSFVGPMLITFDGDQTLYSDGANFESNRRLAHYLYLLLKHGVTVAVVTAAGYEYRAEKYEYRLSGLLAYFAEQKLPPEDCSRFYLFGGECNYLLQDYRLHAVRENGPGGWMTSTMHLADSPGHWNEEEVTNLLDVAEKSVSETQVDLKMRGRVLRKKRSIGLVPFSTESLMPREALDEAVLRVQQQLTGQGGANISLPFCAFNGGRDVWVDVGNKRVGVQVLQSYLGIDPHETLHIGDQFLNTGNDFAARDVCPCIWITSPEETTYILKSILRFANVSIDMDVGDDLNGDSDPSNHGYQAFDNSKVDFSEIERRDNVVKKMDVFTGEMLS